MEHKSTSPITKALRWFFVRGRGDSPFKTLLIHATLIVASVIAVYPVLRVVTISLRPNDTLLTTDLRIIPQNATLDNYKEVLFGSPEKNRKSDFFLWLWNSLSIVSVTSIISMILAAVSAYAFSRFKFPGRAVGLVFLLTTQMIPAGMLLLPLFIMLAQLKMINTALGLIIAYSVSSVPLTIWTLKGYYDTIPVDLEEAALIDGANRFTVFTRIILPLSTPALAIAFLFSFMGGWSEYLVARVVLQKNDMFTWPLGIFTYAQQFTVSWGQFSAASVMIAIPVMALFLYSSKWLISGLTLGSVKG
ncbi:MAG: sugar ABC transporter permease [Anaerolineaceae bacterium]|jgi:arabinogalactan oligomer/maltooligosaccharide transport system permease protein|nr:sugar ABC transporter permease [Anaerolineae bacterium]MBL1172963.1 sugar ABC transporter permease [Chloroflexota bacterium]MBV6467955.1 Maltose transport system permease protein MalG [Anaerolineales bacterium]MCE7905762.1 sugar ABC transporter permease [Anaerolineae bacterium CFX3]MDL1926593.1 sugar ABC transporter permease [Anaerolineae bacterium AMX1]OQY85694.1 MAG: ABC transporter [Anaerolineae bacterium UTCFX3]GER79597.1 ABC transporter [Candidatus Denitrolinea symbiosum]GJQ38176.1 M